MGVGSGHVHINPTKPGRGEGMDSYGFCQLQGVVMKEAKKRQAK